MSKTDPGRKRPGQLNAAAIVKALSEAEVRERLRLTPEELECLSTIASGRPMRHAQSVIKAIALKLEFSQSKPKQEVGLEHSGGVIVEIRKASDHED